MFLLLGEKSPFCVSQNQDPQNPLAFFRKLGQQKLAHEVRLLRSNHYCTLALMRIDSGRQQMFQK